MKIRMRRVLEDDSCDMFDDRSMICKTILYHILVVGTRQAPSVLDTIKKGPSHLNPSALEAGSARGTTSKGHKLSWSL